MNDYTQKRDRIIDALRDLPRWYLREGEAMSRYTHGRSSFRGKPCYEIAIQWHRRYAHHMTGIVHVRVIGRGADFDEALANAVKRAKAVQP
jgi:hypothetical protein